jgi:maltooligosyltrehalose synthase
VLLKLTSPGVPDIYQGNELWDFSLVDPDNRRPVDYGRCCALLAELKNQADSFARTLEDEAVLVVVPRLVARLTGGIEQPPLGIGVWQDTWLALAHEQAGRRYRNLFTGEVLSVGEHDGAPGLPLAAVCGRFPVALLERVIE